MYAEKGAGYNKDDTSKVRGKMSTLPPYTINRDNITPGDIWDSHCHLDFIAKRLSNNGIQNGEKLEVCLNQDHETFEDLFGGCIANFCDPRDWASGYQKRNVSRVVESCQRQERVFITIGCHPHFAYHLGDMRLSQLARLVKEPNLAVAIGECGLDKSQKNNVPLCVQRRAFVAQLKLALEFKLPLVLHIRNAEVEARQVLQEMESRKPQET